MILGAVLTNEAHASISNLIDIKACMHAAVRVQHPETVVEGNTVTDIDYNGELYRSTEFSVLGRSATFALPASTASCSWF